MANNRFQTVNCEIFAHGDSWNWQCELRTERKLNRNISAELKHHCAWLPDAYVCDEHVALKVAVVTKSNKQIGPRLAVRWKPWHCTVIKLELDPNLLDNLKLAEVLTVSQFGIAVIINTQSTYKSYSEINSIWQNSTLLYLSVFLLQDSLYGFPRLFTVTSEHIRLFTFQFFLFLHFFSCRFRAVD